MSFSDAGTSGTGPERAILDDAWNGWQAFLLLNATSETQNNLDRKCALF
jgi:hypothetical protein